MDKAQSYLAGNTLQKRDARQALDEFVPRMRWAPGELVLDVGCGPGDVTVDILLPRMPSGVRHVVGTDLDPTMVRHANERYCLPGLSFAQMDIADVVICTADTSALADDLVPSSARQDGDADVEGDGRPCRPLGFTKVFSFYCLHWVQDQRRAVQSVERLLAPQGEGLVVFLAKSPMFELYEHMAERPKWNSYMSDVSRYVSPYQHTADPARQFHTLLADAGLEVLHCSCRNQTFAFDSMEVLRKSVVAVNPFLDRIPVEKREEYVEDCMSVITRLGLIVEPTGSNSSDSDGRNNNSTISSNNISNSGNNNNSNNNNNNNNNKCNQVHNHNSRAVNTRYSLIVAHVRKP